MTRIASLRGRIAALDEDMERYTSADAHDDRKVNDLAEQLRSLTQVPTLVIPWPSSNPLRSTGQEWISIDDLSHVAKYIKVIHSYEI